MENTDKTSALILTSLMTQYRIKKVFASPGSRNVPLLMAFSRNQDIDVEMVIDERSAAFMALGYASIAGEPVALLCTSGTAMLNYMPAIAEAHYRQVPLLVITADRPQEWIGQKDSQTLIQPCGFVPYVKKSIDIQDFSSDDKQKCWWCNRVINDALIACTDSPSGPVHINIQFDNPLSQTCEDIAIEGRKIANLNPSGKLDTGYARELGKCIASPHRVMLVVGGMPPSQKITKAITKLSSLPNVVILAENLANIHCDHVLTQIDAAVSFVEKQDDKNRYLPDTVIYFGGSIVSGRMKQFLRQCHPKNLWYVGLEEVLIDTFMALTMRINMDPEIFLPQLASAMVPHRNPSDYAECWQKVRQIMMEGLGHYIDSIPWCSFKALSMVLSRVPSKWNVQLSNGMSVRLSQQFDAAHIHRWDCNRGVSGIDGSTSTALGAQLAYRHGVTLLITGDMSLAYDLTALGTKQVTNRMRVIVLKNGGGNIFRCIPTTQSLPELETCLEVDSAAPFTKLAEAWGWKCFDVGDESDMENAMEAFIKDSDRPCMMVATTDGRKDSEVWKQYFPYVADLKLS